MVTRSNTLLVLVLGLIVVSPGCAKPPEDRAPKTVSEREDRGDSGTSGKEARAVTTAELKPELKPVVVFHTDPPVRATVELARTARQIQRGLMYREHLAPDAGMLFLMPEERVQTFWMKNTLIPLDMVFVTSDMVVAGVVANTEPLTTSPRTVGVPSRYVVEVNGGWTEKNGVKKGTRVTFENVEGAR